MRCFDRVASAVFLIEYRHLFQTTTTYPSREWLQESLQIFREEVEAVKSVEGVNPQIISYTIPSRVILGMDDRGGNALGLSGVRGPLLSKLASACNDSDTD